MNMNFDPAAFLREFGLSIVVVFFIGWVIVSACRALLPPIGAAIGRWIDAQTKGIEETTAVVRKIPDVIAQCFKETRDAISAFEKAYGITEANIRSDLKNTETNIRSDVKASMQTLRDDLFDDRQKKIDKDLNALKRVSGIIVDPDTDPAPHTHKK